MGVAKPSNQASAEDQKYFLPDRCIINVIKRAVANKQNVLIELKDVGRIAILSSRGECVVETKRLDEICQADIEQLEVSVLSDDKLQKYSGVIGRNIDELLWSAGFYASNGKLMKGCFGDDVVKLRHWPNVTRIPVTPNTMRIIALLTGHPTSIVLAKHLLKIDIGELHQFYSAARCAGIAHVLNRKPDDPILKPHRNRALLGLLLDKIAGL